MKLEVYGGPKHGGWSGHGEYEPGADPDLRPCPFCGSKNLTVDNTHTPFYTAQCLDCETEGPRAYGIGDRWHRRMSRKAVTALHQQAFLAAIEMWNVRCVGGYLTPSQSRRAR